MSEASQNLRFSKERYVDVHTAISGAAGDATTLKMRIDTILGQLEPLRGLDSSSLFAGIKAGIAEAKDRASEGFDTLVEAVSDLDSPHLAHATTDAILIKRSLSPDNSRSPASLPLEQQCSSIEKNMETIEGLLQGLVEVTAAVQAKVRYFANDVDGKVRLADNVVEQIQIYQEETGLI